MNVGMISGLLHPYGKGGPALVTYNLGKYLTSKGINITIFGAIPYNIDETEVMQKYYSGVTLKLHKEKNNFNPLYSQAYYLNQINPKDFDIIHFEVLPGARGFAIPLILKLRKRNIKIIQTVHGWPPYEINFNNYGLFYKIHWRAARLNLQNFCDCIIVNSNSMKILLEDNVKKPITMIPNGIEVDKWKMEKQRISKEFGIAYWGRLSILKGVDTLINGFRKFLNNPNVDATLYIIGSGPMEQEACALAKELKIEKNIKFLGYLTQQNIIDVLEYVDVCVFVSRYEGFGMAILEAMSAGKCVIGSDVGGIKDIIKHFENGLLIPPDNPQALADTLLLTYYDDFLRAELSQNALSFSKKYDWNAIAEKYILLYNRFER